ncbi:MAG: alanine/glycine:cation symporter family protein [Bacteroidota bacterium]
MKKRILLFLAVLVLPFFTFAQEAQRGWDEAINDAVTPATKFIFEIIFYPWTYGPDGDTSTMPYVIILLLGAATIFTIYFGFINIRRFPLAINVVQGKYDEIEGSDEPLGNVNVNVVDGDIVDTIKKEGEEGEVSHFQALTAALSGTVGLGNISGVAIAIAVGGPGATFWMIVAGLLGMSSKFAECTLGVKYRDVGPDGTVYGGPMYYLSKGLSEKGMAGLGKVLAAFFAVMCIGGSFGGGNMFQANQAAAQFNNMIGASGGNEGVLFGVVMSALVAIVILGGIKRIASVTEKIVPFMVGIYLLAALVVIFMNVGQLPAAFGKIFNGAFTGAGVTGGFIGVLIQGFRRAAFSNEAGVGSAAIAHSAVKTKYAASEGVVALLEPFIDTVVVCTITALVIIITGYYTNTDGLGGVDLTSAAFESVIPWFPYVLTIAVVLFAFSTMISWSYYGLQSWLYLFGRSKVNEYVYKILFCLFVIVGAAASLGAVTDFSDSMIFAMAIPNLIGVFLLMPKVREELNRYLKAIGER